MSERLFSHEQLDVYKLSLTVVRTIQAHEFPRGMGWLKDQLCRASGSVVLNIAEAYGRTGNARRNHLRIAYGSVAEVTAGLDVLGGQAELQRTCRRIGAMLASLNRR